MKREYNVVIERDSEGFYVASVPKLPGCHAPARSLDKLRNRIKEVIELCLEVEDSVVTPPALAGENAYATPGARPSGRRNVRLAVQFGTPPFNRASLRRKRRAPRPRSAGGPPASSRPQSSY